MHCIIRVHKVVLNISIRGSSWDLASLLVGAAAILVHTVYDASTEKFANKQKK